MLSSYAIAHSRLEHVISMDITRLMANDLKEVLIAGYILFFNKLEINTDHNTSGLFTW